MTKSTIPRKQLIKKAQEQIEFCRHTKITGEGRAHVNQCAALFEIALAAMNGEPVTWGNGCDKTVPAALRYLAENERPFGGESRFNAAHLYQLAREIELMAEAPLYRHAQPALTGNFPIIGIDLATGPDRTVEVSYVAPPGYVMVPMRLTAENGAKGALSGEFSETKFVNCSECFCDDECETCDGSGRIEITVPVSWTTIKEIWAKGVEHFAAALQEVK